MRRGWLLVWRCALPCSAIHFSCSSLRLRRQCAPALREHLNLASQGYSAVRVVCVGRIGEYRLEYEYCKNNTHLCSIAPALLHGRPSSLLRLNLPQLFVSRPLRSPRTRTSPFSRNEGARYVLPYTTSDIAKPRRFCRTPSPEQSFFNRALLHGLQQGEVVVSCTVVFVACAGCFKFYLFSLPLLFRENARSVPTLGCLAHAAFKRQTAHLCHCKALAELFES